MSDIPVQRRLAALTRALEPLVAFLRRDAVVEILLNADGAVWCEEAGRGMYKTGVTLAAADAERIIRLLAAAMDTEINDRNPSLAAKLPGWGARAQAAVPPIVEAPVFAFRKPSRTVFTLADYVHAGILTEAQGALLREAVLTRKNVLVGGGTGSGKTTLVNALLHVLAETRERVYLVEDTPELRCAADNKVQILVQPPLYTHRRAVMDALRFRPDRIVVGEVRDGAALEMLKAWNTGHPGGLATVHANDPAAMLDRLGQLIEEVLPRAPRRLIAEAVDLCVHLRRDPTHPAGRTVGGIVRVAGAGEEGWILEPISG